MSDANGVAVGKVSFTNIDIPGGVKAFMLRDFDNGNTLTFIEIGNGTDEWALKRNHDPVPEIIATAAARALALESDQIGIGRVEEPAILREAA